VRVAQRVPSITSPTEPAPYSLSEPIFHKIVPLAHIFTQQTGWLEVGMGMSRRNGKAQRLGIRPQSQYCLCRIRIQCALINGKSMKLLICKKADNVTRLHLQSNAKLRELKPSTGTKDDDSGVDMA
jgi:hypothetical protein